MRFQFRQIIQACLMIITLGGCIVGTAFGVTQPVTPTPATTATSTEAQGASIPAKDIKQKKTTDVFHAQSYYLTGVGQLAMEFRYKNNQLVSMFFWNKGDNSVSINALGHDFVVPKKGEYEFFTKGDDIVLVTVKPFDPMMSQRLKQSFPGHHFVFEKNKKGLGYTLYELKGDPKWYEHLRKEQDSKPKPGTGSVQSNPWKAAP